MALTHIEPIPARVSWDRRHSRPRSVAWQGGELRVTEVASRRDELAAFPAGGGPRITYLLETDGGGRASVVYDARHGAWYVDGLEAA